MSSSVPLTRIRVAVTEDEDVLRNGLRERITSDDRFLCDDVFSTAEDLLNSPNLYYIDVFLVDIKLPGMSGITAIGELRRRNVNGQVLMLTNFDDDDHVRDAVLAGARGYLLKTTPTHRLIDGLIEIHAGGAPMNSSVASIVLDYVAQLPRPSALSMLSDRERNVLGRLAEGMQYKEISESMYLSLETVRSHVRKNYAKLNVHNRREAEALYRKCRDA